MNSNRNRGKDVPSLAYDPGYVSGVRWNNKSFNECAYLITKCFYTTVEGSTSINIPYVAI